MKSLASANYRGVNLADWYKDKANAWVESGVVSRDVLNNAPDVKKAMQKDVIDIAKNTFREDSTISNPLEKCEEYLEQIESTGIFSKQEMMNWKQIKRLSGY